MSPTLHIFYSPGFVCMDSIWVDSMLVNHTRKMLIDEKKGENAAYFIMWYCWRNSLHTVLMIFHYVQYFDMTTCCMQYLWVIFDAKIIIAELRFHFSTKVQNIWFDLNEGKFRGNDQLCSNFESFPWIGLTREFFCVNA